MAIMLRHPAWPNAALDDVLQHRARAATREGRTREPDQVQAVENWRCMIHFPDGTQGIHLIPGPAPVPTPDSMAAIVSIEGQPGTWFVREITTFASSPGCAAEIWVEHHELEADGSPHSRK